MGTEIAIAIMVILVLIAIAMFVWRAGSRGTE